MKMKILILSDLHLEFWGSFAHSLESKPDVVVLAGDIHNHAHALGPLSTLFADSMIIYVPGNHEYYGTSIEAVDMALDICSYSYDNVQVLNSRTLEVPFDNVRFIGATLWTDFELYGKEKLEESMLQAAISMPDYKVIRNGNATLRPTDTRNFHRQQLDFIERELAVPFDGKTIVITHHLPSIKSVPVRFFGDGLNPAFASNLDHIVEKADIWIHGHTHDSFDYQIGKCRVLCNPRGYRRHSLAPENPNFNPNFLIEV